MKNRIQILLACTILLVSALLFLTYADHAPKEARVVVRDTSEPRQSAQVIKVSSDSKSEQAKNTNTIINAFKNYSEENMRQAILSTFDKSVLEEKTTDEILMEMPQIVKLLKNTEVEKTISETPNKITLKMKKNDNTYLLDIFFVEKSQKISKMGVAKLS